MPKLTDEEIENILNPPPGSSSASSDTRLRLATISPDGWPSNVPLGFMYREGQILLTVRPKAKWVENIRQNPRVCATIDSGIYPLRKVMITGNARILFDAGQDEEWLEWRVPRPSPNWGPKILEDGREEWSWSEAYATASYDESRILVGIELAESRVTSWRMPLLGEYLDTLWAPSYYTRATPTRFRVSHIDDSVANVRVIAERDDD